MSEKPDELEEEELDPEEEEEAIDDGDNIVDDEIGIMLDSMVSEDFMDGLINVSEDHNLKFEVINCADSKKAKRDLNRFASESDKDGNVLIKSIKEWIVIGSVLVIPYYNYE